MAAPKPTRRRSERGARAEALALKTEASPLERLQPETDAEFSASGEIPAASETTTSYVDRLRAEKKKKTGKEASAAAPRASGAPKSRQRGSRPARRSR